MNFTLRALLCVSVLGASASAQADGPIDYPSYDDVDPSQVAQADPSQIAGRARRLYIDELGKGMPALVRLLVESSRAALSKPADHQTAQRRRPVQQVVKERARPDSHPPSQRLPRRKTRRSASTDGCDSGRSSARSEAAAVAYGWPRPRVRSRPARTPGSSPGGW